MKKKIYILLFCLITSFTNNVSADTTFNNNVERSLNSDQSNWGSTFLSLSALAVGTFVSIFLYKKHNFEKVELKSYYDQDMEAYQKLKSKVDNNNKLIEAYSREELAEAWWKWHDSDHGTLRKKILGIPMSRYVKFPKTSDFLDDIMLRYIEENEDSLIIELNNDFEMRKKGIYGDDNSLFLYLVEFYVDLKGDRLVPCQDRLSAFDLRFHNFVRGPVYVSDYYKSEKL